MAPADRPGTFLAEQRVGVVVVLVQWMTGLVETRRLTDGPLGAGTRWRQVHASASQKITVDVELTRVEPPHRLESREASHPLRGRSGSRFRSTSAYVLEDEGEGARTRLTNRWDVEYEESMLVLRLPALADWLVRRRLGRNLRQLKQAVEGSIAR